MPPQLSIGDTIGVATAGHVTELVGAFAASGLGTEHLAMHFHDTYGQALADTLAALRAGGTTYDASAGGLGGCPYAKSATGNLATEDLVWLLTGLGIEHGVDLPGLVETSTWLAGDPAAPSAVVRALPPTPICLRFSKHAYAPPPPPPPPQKNTKTQEKKKKKKKKKTY